MSKGIQSRRTGVVSVMAGCFDCDSSGAARWETRNALACAANHARATGHHTWCDQVLSTTYNRPSDA